MRATIFDNCIDDSEYCGRLFGLVHMAITNIANLSIDFFYLFTE
jgi:hypothetical protein